MSIGLALLLSTDFGARDAYVCVRSITESFFLSG